MFDFSNHKSILEPSMFIKNKGNFPKTVLATWQKGISDCALKSDPKKIATFTGGTISTIYEVEGIAFCHIPSGGPNAAVFIEECTARGAESFVFVGNCGILDKDASDKILIPTRALRDEGTSSHYTDSKEDFLEVDTADITEALVSDYLKTAECPFEVLKTPVWTTDCPYRETSENVDKALSMGCKAVEMECASIMAVSQFRNVRSYQILFPADTLYNKTWKEGLLKNMNMSLYSFYYNLALNVAHKISV